MTSVEWIELFHLIPQDQHNKVIFVLQNGLEINIDIIVRIEPSFIAFRGRASGSTDDGRVFFLPYSQVACAYLNRYVKDDEAAAIFGDGSASESSAMPIGGDEDSAIMPPPPPTAPALIAPTPMLIPPTASPAPTRLTTTPMPPAAVARPAAGLIPPAQTAPTGDTPTPKGGSILERLRAQRGTMNRPR